MDLFFGCRLLVQVARLAEFHANINSGCCFLDIAEQYVVPVDGSTLLQLDLLPLLVSFMSVIARAINQVLQ